MSHKYSKEPWIGAGIPGQGSICRLLYNRPSDTLAVVVHKQAQAGLSVNRLFFRTVAESSYCPIPVLERLETQEDAASSDAAPFLIYNIMQFRPPQEGFTVFAADWTGVCKFNLETRVADIVLNKHSLRPSLPYTAGWVSSIISAWPDGNGAVCRVGLQRSDAKGLMVTDSFVYEVSFKDGLGRQVAALPRVFL